MCVRLLLAVILTAAPALAQRGGGGGVDPGAMGMSAPRPQSAASKALMFADRLKLDKEQKAQTEVILNEALKEIAQLRNQMGQTRAQIINAMLRSDNQEEVKKLMEVYSAAAAQVTAIETKAFAKVCALLKPNQQSRAPSAFGLLADTLDPPGSAGMGAPGGGRRGKH